MNYYLKIPYTAMSSNISVPLSCLKNHISKVFKAFLLKTLKPRWTIIHSLHDLLVQIILTTYFKTFSDLFDTTQICQMQNYNASSASFFNLIFKSA